MSIVVTRRKELKWSQDKIAKKINISRQYYNEIENGKRTPSVKIAKELADLLGISWTIFFDKSVNK
ncbi:helix-turn-helix transcriptional regulator [Ferviditalea candida]|uniref:Helix-turn-helix transcriptional regulator n=1 Tax=Ferviditalea candida TaxID=3108399 RepID=A0ABU5ZKK0_9BACL|nr:helix-turn-helix transcriptional regulator [Paenibacillaceae bacterium T2]